MATGTAQPSGIQHLGGSIATEWRHNSASLDIDKTGEASVRAREARDTS